MAIEQQNDIFLQQLRLKLQKEEYSETTLQQDSCYRHYCSHFDRLSVQMISSPETTLTKQATSNSAKRYFRNIL